MFRQLTNLWETEHCISKVATGINATDDDRPHVIKCELHRSKLDANQDLGEAAFGDPSAELAWREYHQFIDDAKMVSTMAGSRAFYIDINRVV